MTLTSPDRKNLVRVFRASWFLQTSNKYHNLRSRGRSGAACLGDLAEHAILHPFRVPPLHGIHRLSIDEHREMQVISAGEAGHAAPPDHLCFLDLLTRLDVDGRQMRVERLD